MALLPNNVFERNQTAAGRQAVEQTQLRNNAARAETPMQARNNVPPTDAELIQMTIGNPAPQSTLPESPLLQAGRAVGGIAGTIGSQFTGGDPGVGSGFTPQQLQQAEQAGAGSMWNMRSPGQIMRGQEAVPAGQPRPTPPSAPAPPSSIAAPPPDAIRAPAQVPASSGGTGYQAPNLMDTVAQGIEGMSAPETTPQAPLQPDVVGSPGYTGGSMTDTPGVYTDSTMRGGATTGNGTFNVMNLGGGGGLGVGASGGAGGGVMPTGAQSSAPALQQPGGELVDKFLQAREAYLNMPSGGGMKGLAERGRALNALRALAPQATTEQTTQAAMYGDDRALQRGIGVANIGRDSQLGSTAMTQMGGMDRAVLQANTQQRGQDLTYGVGMANAGTNRMNAEAQMAGAQPAPVEQVLNQAAVEMFQNGQLQFGDLARVANGEAPYTPTPIFNQMSGEFVGVQGGSGVQAPNAQLVALMEAAGIAPENMSEFVQAMSQQQGQ